MFIEKIFHSLIVIVFLFWNIAYCSDWSHSDEHSHHQTVHTETNHDCCPTQHPISKWNQITGIIEQQETRKLGNIHLPISFKENIVSSFLIQKEIRDIPEYRDRQHFFFTDTIRLIV